MKHKALLICLFFLTGFFFISDPVLAAWTQPKGHAYNQLTFGHYVTKKKFTTLMFDSSGEIIGWGDDVNRVQQPKFTSTKITYYGEYGIIDSLTVFITIPWDWQKSDDTIRYSGERGPSGVGDIGLGLRYNLVQNLFGSGVLMSLQGEVKIPEAYEYGSPLEDLSLGDGQYDATLALLFGRGLGKGYAWLNAGYKFRFENNQFDPINFRPSDQIKVIVGGGYAVTSWLSIRGLIDWAKSVGNASVSQELIIENGICCGGLARHQDHVLIRDTLGLEPSSLAAGIDLAFNIKPQIQAVLTYNRDLNGFKPFESRDWSLGETYSLALVYMY
ncbi:MAG: hypothetical protein KAI96_00315 [Thermodesulfovibrionia bacterium]|nr:hypothetical protein [Thermodesulfovibrionia bacterium]